MYVRSDIPSKLLTKHSFPNDIEGLFAEINFRKSKWLLFGTCHPPSQNNQYYFDCLDKALDVYSSYEKVILTVDFNVQESECVLDSFLYQHDLTSLVKVGTCYKNQRNSSCIDLYLTNSLLSFQNTSSVFAGLSDFHKLVLMVCTCEKEVGKGNQAPYMTEALRKAIMRRSELETKCFKQKTNDTLKAYKKQKNYCSRLYQKERKKFLKT